jgi:hypothetical protein
VKRNFELIVAQESGCRTFKALNILSFAVFLSCKIEEKPE